MISFLQQEFLLESIRKVPELVESKKQMANQIEKEENEISEKNKIFSTQEEKIKSMEIESKGTISISVKEVFRVVTRTDFWKTFQFPVHTLLIMVNFRNNSSESTLGSFKGVASRRIY